MQDTEAKLLFWLTEVEKGRENNPHIKLIGQKECECADIDRDMKIPFVLQRHAYNVWYFCCCWFDVARAPRHALLWSHPFILELYKQQSLSFATHYYLFRFDGKLNHCFGNGSRRRRNFGIARAQRAIERVRSTMYVVRSCAISLSSMASHRNVRRI